MIKRNNRVDELHLFINKNMFVIESKILICEVWTNINKINYNFLSKKNKSSIYDFSKI